MSTGDYDYTCDPLATSESMLADMRVGAASGWWRLAGTYSALIYEWAKRADLQDADAQDVLQEVLFFFIVDRPSSSEHLTELLKKLNPQLVEKHAKLRKDAKARGRKASATIKNLVVTATKKGTVLSSPQPPTIFGSEASEYGW